MSILATGSAFSVETDGSQVTAPQNTGNQINGKRNRGSDVSRAKAPSLTSLLRHATLNTTGPTRPGSPNRTPIAPRNPFLLFEPADEKAISVFQAVKQKKRSAFSPKAASTPTASNKFQRSEFDQVPDFLDPKSKDKKRKSAYDSTAESFSSSSSSKSQRSTADSLSSNSSSTSRQLTDASLSPPVYDFNQSGSGTDKDADAILPGIPSSLVDFFAEESDNESDNGEIDVSSLGLPEALVRSDSLLTQVDSDDERPDLMPLPVSNGQSAPALVETFDEARGEFVHRSISGQSVPGTMLARTFSEASSVAPDSEISSVFSSPRDHSLTSPRPDFTFSGSVFPGFDLPRFICPDSAPAGGLDDESQPGLPPLPDLPFAPGFDDLDD